MGFARKEAMHLAGGVCLGERVRACLLGAATKSGEVD